MPELTNTGALTVEGMPRPRLGRSPDGDTKLPVPWVSPIDDLGVMNKGRYRACASGRSAPCAAVATRPTGGPS